MESIFGYACISDLYPQLKAGSTSTLTYINKLPEPNRGAYLLPKAKSNIQGMAALLQKNHANGINAYRMSDSFMPMADLGYYNWEDVFGKDLETLGSIANKFNMFLSFHPSQFFVLNSATPHVVDSAIKNFNIFADVLRLMKLKNKPVLLTHVGARSTYATQDAACDAFSCHFERLSPAAQEYFAVENDQSAHSIDSCLYIHKQIGIPVVLDNAHYNYKPVQGMSLADAAAAVIPTWGDRVPKFHVSSELEGSPRHAHADYVTKQDFTDFYNAVNSTGAQKVIWMFEAKKKDRAVLNILDKFNK
jgi:UV DNA damage endonuclease